MKKHLAVIMLAVFMMVLAGCGGKKIDAPVVGDWKLSTVEAMGQTMTVEDFAALTGSDVEMKIYIKDNGTFSANFEGESGEGKWEYEEPTITLKDDTDTLTGEYKDGKITLSIDEGGESYSMTFEK